MSFRFSAVNLTLFCQASMAGVLTTLLLGCQPSTSQSADVMPTPSLASSSANPAAIQGKPVVYQVFTRLFGNTNTTNKPWGSIEENGVGKFADFTDTALTEIHAMGVTHIWYTGVPHHASATDYTRYGIDLDDPDVIKGRAGSPYAVRDYYNVDPDLARDPAQRMAEFEALIKRTHAHNMKVIIDIVPNHVARRYASSDLADNAKSLGANDDSSKAYAVNNDFYYVPGEAFKVPVHPAGFHPTGGAPHPLADGQFDEQPAKWTGNGARAAQPDANDWYETVKINYGVKPDGSYDFPELPTELANATAAEVSAFWAQQTLPGAWYKMRDIALFWLDKGVDGFRFDMAEMVPVAFWSFLNAEIKQANPDAFLLAEVYQPDLYRAYLNQGKMDFLYDKVGLYDTMKRVMQQQAPASTLDDAIADVQDIAPSMLNFLENHDEQRIASPDFAEDPMAGRPATVVSALYSASPFLLYFGQEVGEDGSEDMGFGDPTRTTIFDYAGVPAHQRWMNEGAFDGGQLNPQEAALRQFYVEVMNIASGHPAMQAPFVSLQSLQSQQYPAAVYSFARLHEQRPLIGVSNFSDSAQVVNLILPRSTAEFTGMTSLISRQVNETSLAAGTLSVTLPPRTAGVFELTK